MSEREWSCEEVIEQLFAYLDGELTDKHLHAIDQHLGRCRECFSRAEFERRLRARVNATAQVQAPERLRRRINDILDRYQ